MSAIAENKYNPVVDLLRTIAILAVILIHTSTKVLVLFKFDLVHHPLTLFLNQASRFAVPLFFLISAFVLELNYPQNFNYFSYLKKRFSRLFLPYLFWSFIYYFFVYTYHTQNFASTLFYGTASYQLYFIPALFIFYLIFPLFHYLADFFSRKIILILLVIFQIIILSFDYYHRPLAFSYPISVFLLNFGPFILGILASRYQEKISDFVKKYSPYFLVSSTLFAFLITLEGGSLYYQTHNYLSFYSQWRPSVFLYTLILGAYLYFCFSRIKLNPTLIKKIASYSFFVFFIHVIFLEIVWKYLPHPFLSFPLILFIIVSFLSYLSAFLVSKTKFIPKLTG
jgi:surface polysaccharide O-acyltransferase-like enzyme